jgi:ABC-2 type transport system permease protein
MSAVLFRRTLMDRRRWLIGWTIGIIALVVVSLAFWPSLKDQGASLSEAIDKMPESMKALFGMGGGLDPFSPIGYLASQIYSLMLPLLLLVAAIGFGAGLASDEEHGLLEMTLGAPVSRTRVVLERFAALTAALLILSIVSYVSTAVSVAAVGLDAGKAAVLWATVATSVLALVGGAISLAVSALTGRRSIAIAASSVIMITSYLVTSLAAAGISFFKTLEPYSVFTLTDVVPTLRRGTPGAGVAVLVGVALLAAVVAAWGFNRRDLRG